jgi:hypothetical protein
MKRTVPQLADRLAELTGLPESLHQQQARRAREAGFLSQAGHGRGAAAATSMDAAMMLLIAAVGLSSRYTEAAATALDATRPDYEDAGSLKIKGSNAVEMLASLIERRHDVWRVDVHVGNPLSVVFIQDQDLDDPGQVTCQLSERSRAGKRFLKVQGRTPMAGKRGLRRQTMLEPWMFEDIAEYLGIEWDEGEAKDAT